MISVVCAVLWQHGKVLLAQRGPNMSQAGCWELPGGKLEAGESAEQALRRELREELNLEVEIGNFLAETTWHDQSQGLSKVIHLQAFHGYAKDWSCLRLTEHQAVFWYRPTETLELGLAPADVPLIDALRDQVRRSPHGGSR